MYELTSKVPQFVLLFAVPITSSVYKYMNGRTTYDTDVNDRVLRYYYGVENVRELVAEADKTADYADKTAVAEVAK